MFYHASRSVYKKNIFFIDSDKCMTYNTNIKAMKLCNFLEAQMATSPFVTSLPSPIHDCVYYWEQDKQRWTRATLVPSYLGGTAKTLAELKAEIIKGGRSAVLGNSSIGAPEGPPIK